MIIRGIHVEHWCCIAQLDLDDLPPGIVVLHGPNRTGKSSLVKALRGCLFDFDHDTTRSQFKSSVPWNSSATPKLAVEFETAGRLYRIVKVFSKKSDGLTKLEQQGDGQWHVVEDSPKEVSRRTRELLGADKSTLGLNQLLWPEQGEIDLPDVKALDHSLERQLVSVLGVMVTGQDLRFKQVLDKRCKEWFSPGGKARQKSLLTLWQEQREQRQKKLAEEQVKYRELEQAISGLEECESHLPELRKAVLAAGQELAEREQERERSQQRRQQYELALRDFRVTEQQALAARNALQSFHDAKCRWQEAEAQTVRAEAAEQRTREESVHLATEHDKIACQLHAVRLDEEKSQGGLEEIEDRRKLVQLAERRARLAKDLGQVRQLQQETVELQGHLKHTLAPDKSTMDALHENRLKASKYRAQLHAGELTLTVTLEQPSRCQLRLDDGPSKTEELAPGQKHSWPFRQRGHFELPDIGCVEISRPQKDIDLERTAGQLGKLDQEYRQNVHAFGEQPDDEGCMNRLAERWAEREEALAKLAATWAALQQLAPHGLVALESEWSRLDSQRRIVLDRRPDLAEWTPAEQETQQREGEFRAQCAALQRTRKDLELAEKQAKQALQKAQAVEWDSNQKAVAARTTSKNALAEMQRLGDELSLQGILEQADRDHATAAQRLDEARLSNEEMTIDQRFQNARGALKNRQERLQQLKDEMNRYRGRLEGSEGLHTRLADAEAAVREADELLAREHLEAEAHKRLRDLFEACRDCQVQEVMRPIGDRVLNWAQSLGLNEYREVRFGERFLPEGLVLRNGDLDRVHCLSEESYGTSEQLSLLVRLAIGGILANGEPAVTILDDPLAHADAVKHRRILDIMRLATEGNPAWTPPAGQLQILIFTCHPDRFDYLTGVRQIDLGKLIVRET